MHIDRPDPLRHVMPGPRLAVVAEALFLINLMLLPGLAFLALMVLWAMNREHPDPLVRNHLRQTGWTCIWGGLLLVVISVAIFLLDQIGRIVGRTVAGNVAALDRAGHVLLEPLGDLAGGGARQACGGRCSSGRWLSAWCRARRRWQRAVGHLSWGARFGTSSAVMATCIVL